MTEVDIIKLLLKSHNEKNWLCVPHCKTGPSWDNKHLGIIDLWCLKKAYARPLVIGYEIKTARSDFLQDDKWQDYLDYCNEFYFVVPNLEVASPEDMNVGIGLKVVSKTGTRIFTKKQSRYFNIEIPTSIYKHILISRVKYAPDKKKWY